MESKYVEELLHLLQPFHSHVLHGNVFGKYEYKFPLKFIIC